MAFPSSANKSLRDILDQLRNDAGTVKVLSTNIRAASLTGTLSYPVIMTYMAGLKAARARMNGLATTTGLLVYAQDQLGNSSLDIASEYTTMASALDATVAWIAGNLPKDGSNYALSIQISADGSTTDRLFTSVQLNGLRTQIDALLATIS